MKPGASRNVYWYYSSGSLGFGVLLLVIGGYFLAKHFGWITVDLPFWPTLLVVLGIYLIYRSFRKPYF